MKSAREAEIRALAQEILGNPCRGLAPGHHSVECDRVTAAIESRDREHAEEVERLRAELTEAQGWVRRLHELRDDLRASLATVTADRDAARSALAEARVALRDAPLPTCNPEEHVKLGQRVQRAEKLLNELQGAIESYRAKAEAALAASVRREDVVRWLENRKAQCKVAAASARARGDVSWARTMDSEGDSARDIARLIADGSWLRDLTTMDGRPAEAPRAKCDGCGAVYKAAWAGTTCSVCDATIPSPVPAAHPVEAKPRLPWCTCPESKQGTADQEWAHKKASCLEEDIIVTAVRPANKETA